VSLHTLFLSPISQHRVYSELIVYNLTPAVKRDVNSQQEAKLSL